MPETEQNPEEGRRLTVEPADDQPVLPPPPDGGYGWVVVFASFMCNLAVDGIGYSFGIFLPALVEFFGQGKGTVAWVGSLLAGTMLVAGPIVSALCNKYGCRAVCIAGGIVSSAALVLSTFSQSVTVMMLSYGVLGGFGFGMIYLPSIVAVGYYFDTKRSLATGIAVCGSGVGTFSFAPLATFLLGYLGTWQKANLVLAVIIFCCVLWGFLMKPLTFPETNEKLDLMERMAEEKRMQAVIGSEDTLNKMENGMSTRLSRNVSTPAFSSGLHGGQKRGSVPSLSQRKQSYGDNLQKPDLLLHGSDPSLYHYRKLDHYRKQSFDLGAVYNSKLSVAREPPRMVRPLSRKDIFYSGSVLNLPQYQSQKSLSAFRRSMVSIPQSMVDNATQDEAKYCGCIPASMIDLTLLKDPAFILIAVANFFSMAGLYVPFVYIVDAAQLSGVAESQAAFLLSIIGITNTVARIGCGFVADFPWVDSLLLNNVCLIIATISVGLIPFCTSYILYVAAAVAFGFAIAGFISLTSIILVDLLGLDKLTNAFGLLILFRGVATIIGSPLAGAVYDMTKTYDASFYIGSACFLIATVASFGAKFYQKAPEEAILPSETLARIDEDQEDSESHEEMSLHSPDAPKSGEGK